MVRSTSSAGGSITMKKLELINKLVEGLHMLHLDECHYYTNKHLADTCGVSTSTLKRNKELIKVIDTALYVMEECDGGM